PEHQTGSLIPEQILGRDTGATSALANRLLMGPMNKETRQTPTVLSLMRRIFPTVDHGCSRGCCVGFAYRLASRRLRVPDGAFGYIPRKLEETLLYGAIAEEWETCLARRQERECAVPPFAEARVSRLPNLRNRGTWFLRLHCCKCGDDRILLFSGKRRARV